VASIALQAPIYGSTLEIWEVFGAIKIVIDGVCWVVDVLLSG
jgi:hypothetical protein